MSNVCFNVCAVLTSVLSLYCVLQGTDPAVRLCFTLVPTLSTCMHRGVAVGPQTRLVPTHSQELATLIPRCCDPDSLQLSHGFQQPLLSHLECFAWLPLVCFTLQEPDNGVVYGLRVVFLRHVTKLQGGANNNSISS